MGAMVISVAAECISDARTRLGSNFEPAIRDLLEQGYTVTIEENTGARTFTDPELFSSWFGDAGLYLTRRGQQVDIAQSEIDSGEILRIGVGPAHVDCGALGSQPLDAGEFAFKHRSDGAVIIGKRLSPDDARVVREMYAIIPGAEPIDGASGGRSG